MATKERLFLTVKKENPPQPPKPQGNDIQKSIRLYIKVK